MDVDLERGLGSTDGNGPGPLVALASLAEGKDEAIRVLCLRPAALQERLLSLLQVGSHLGIAPERFTLVTPHPHPGWLGTLCAAGFGTVRLDLRSSFERPSCGRHSIEETLARLCPDLHLKERESAEMCVCGAHGDRLVVSPRRMKRWCLAEHASCPYRMTRGTRSSR
jgi:hypothetical protein